LEAIKKRRLNGWQRLGIIASVLWFLIAAWKIDSYFVRNASMLSTDKYNACLDAQRPSAVCDQERSKEWQEVMQGQFEDTALVGGVPIPFAWLTVYGLIALVRWVRVGFVKFKLHDHRERGLGENMNQWRTIGRAGALILLGVFFGACATAVLQDSTNHQATPAPQAATPALQGVEAANQKPSCEATYRGASDMPLDSRGHVPLGATLSDGRPMTIPMRGSINLLLDGADLSEVAPAVDRSFVAAEAERYGWSFQGYQQYRQCMAK
jgi:hypothetical protein